MKILQDEKLILVVDLQKSLNYCFSFCRHAL